jgi:integrase
MRAIKNQLRQAALEGAAKLPQIVDGDALGKKDLTLKERPNGVWAVFRGSVYLKSSNTRNRAEAELFLKVYRLQLEAREEGIVDARYARMPEIVAYYMGQIPAGKINVRRNAVSRLARLKPYLAGKRLIDMNGVAVAEIEKKMLETYKPGTIYSSFVALRTAVYAWCQGHVTEVVMPFAPLAKVPGRDRVISVEEQKRVERWAGGEDYDPATGTWSKPRHRMKPYDRFGRMMVLRIVELGIGTGTRPGRLMGLAWAPNGRTGHIDVEAGVLHRYPPGTEVPTRKRAPALVLPPKLLAKVRRWKKEDGDQPYAIRTVHGGPRQTGEVMLFSTAMRRLGIVGVTRHTMRHTAITRMIEARVPSAVISAVVGISVELLRTRYNHADETLIQPAAHAAMDRVLARAA